MLMFAVKRLLLAMLTVFVVSVIAFLLVHATDSSPGYIALGNTVPQSAIDAYNERIGWNDPLVTQYLAWLGNALHGDFGTSFLDGHSVSDDMAARLPVTFALAVGATLVSAIVGMFAGIIAAVRGGTSDRVVRAATALAVALPSFWVGILLVWVFAVQLGLLPATGWTPIEQSPVSWLQSLILPVLTLSIAGSAFVARQTRASMKDALTQEYVRTLRATGVPVRQILYIHVLRFASLPIIASIALQFMALFGGSVIIETLFVLPGIGQVVQKAVGSHDAPTVQASVVIATLVVVTVNLLLELGTKLLDPKLRTS